jgi:Zn-dependent protease
MVIVSLIIFFVIFIFSVIIHEYAHGKVANILGDPTAELAGRLTLNPIPHIDPIGSVILPLLLIFSGVNILFGWAKPVPIDPFNLRNPRKDAALIALAGPGVNLIIALIAALLVRITYSQGVTDSFLKLFIWEPIIRTNVVLAVFNLIPVAPLDGFKIVGGILPSKQARDWFDLERYGMIFLILLIIPFGRISLLNMIMQPVLNLLFNLLIPLS